MGRKPSISREKIINTAEEIVANQGISHLTIENIAQKLDITKGGVQYSFDSKDSIIEAMIERWYAGFDKNMKNNLKLPATPENYIKAHIETTRKMQAENKKAAALMAAFMDNYKFRKLIKNWYKPRIEFLKKCTGKNGKKLTLAFMACEGMYLLSNFGFNNATIKEWNNVFSDINAYLIKGEQP